MNNEYHNNMVVFYSEDLPNYGTSLGIALVYVQFELPLVSINRETFSHYLNPVPKKWQLRTVRERGESARANEGERGEKGREGGRESKRGGKGGERGEKRE